MFSWRRCDWIGWVCWSRHEKKRGTATNRSVIVSMTTTDPRGNKPIRSRSEMQTVPTRCAFFRICRSGGQPLTAQTERQKRNENSTKDGRLPYCVLWMASTFVARPIYSILPFSESNKVRLRSHSRNFCRRVRTCTNTSLKILDFLKRMASLGTCFFVIRAPLFFLESMEFLIVVIALDYEYWIRSIGVRTRRIMIARTYLTSTQKVKSNSRIPHHKTSTDFQILELEQ
mmetsp:Transcript_25755/g.56499  ORF Transcript_25755/g.56499 Transcript_25755/m.56499 type:complete len:229 (+) Transcript_25755:1496-2182(+)